MFDATSLVAAPRRQGPKTRAVRPELGPERARRPVIRTRRGAHGQQRRSSLVHILVETPKKDLEHVFRVEHARCRVIGCTVNDILSRAERSSRVQ